MHRFLWIVLVTSVIALLGCESQEQPATKTAPHQVVKPEKTIKAEEAQGKAPAVEAAQAVADQAEKRVEETVKAVEETVEKTVDTATAKAEEVQTSAKEAVSSVESQAGSTVAAMTETMTKPVAVVKETAAPDEIVIEASYGKVTLPHSMHAESYECSICHGDAAPAAFVLGKETAHKVCKGCHKDEGAGPTGCKGCHVK